MAGSAPGIRRRTVFYLCGFDPRGPGYYHRLYREEAAKQAELNGLKLIIGNRERSGPLSGFWNITAEAPDGAVTETRYEFLRWDAIIRQNWPMTESAMFFPALRTLVSSIKSGMMRKWYRYAVPSAIALSYPLAFLFILGGVGLTLGVAVTALLSAIFSLPWWIAPFPIVAAMALSVAAGRWIDRRFHTFWVLRTLLLSFSWSRGEIPDLDDLIEKISLHITDRIEHGGDDEVLIVGHSFGTVLAVSILARIIARQPEIGDTGPSISLMTLGNCIPIVSYQDFSTVFRDQIAAVAHASNVEWVDFSAGNDSSAFAGIDLLTTSGITRDPNGPVRPKMIPPGFYLSFSEERLKEIRRDGFRFHFQYVMSGERLSYFDYFAITAGPLSLKQRYAEWSHDGTR